MSAMKRNVGANVKLKGMTWSHPRGYDPMVACSRIWEERVGVAIDWDKRSLQDFESFPLEKLARTYDLIVIDHPHVGEVAAQGYLAPLDVPGREAERAAIAAGDIGGSCGSYEWGGRQWAFPIDAAAQVQAWRADLIDKPPMRFEDVVNMARKGKVRIPMRPPHSLMAFFTLAANLGTPCAVKAHGDPVGLIALEAGTAVYDLIATLMQHVPDDCYAMDPIAVLELMSEAHDSRVGEVACAPLIYGYVNYAVAGFRPKVVTFSDIPAAGNVSSANPFGSALGGTGIAVSALSEWIDLARDFACWVAGGAIQRGPFAAAGGQPAHRDAWEDNAVNAASGNFYRNTRATLDKAWIRPRHRGYMQFQQQASVRLNAGLRANEKARTVIADLNELFAASFG